MADSDSDNGSSNAYISEEFEKKLASLKARWKTALKRNKKLLLKCPNFERCQFKCGSVGGMHYHFVRCAGAAPSFKCPHCPRQYESRTGLNYHLMSTHGGGDPCQEEFEPSGRPVRSTASPVKLSPQKTTPTPPKTTHTSDTSLTPEKTPPLFQKTTPPSDEQNTPPSASNQSAKPKKLLMLKKTVKPKMKQGSKEAKAGSTGKKGNKSITIPSIEYPDEYKPYLPQWRQEMKDNKIIKCPNFDECEFKCTTVNGMKYHFVRCGKENPPEFDCEVCGKKFQCRTGLVWHLKKHHRLIDIQPTKTGGFRGTVPAEVFLRETVAASKKRQLEARRRGLSLERTLQGAMGRGERRRRGMAVGRIIHGGGGRRNGLARFRKRLRKSNSPRRTAEDILQNIHMLSPPPTPQLGPETTKFILPPTQFQIIDTIPTDVEKYGSTTISVGEEALEWHKMSSDSESESDYFPEQEYNYFRSDSPVSEPSSDEEFMCSLTRKKKSKVKGAAGGGKGAAAPRRTREMRIKKEVQVQPPVVARPPSGILIPSHHKPPPLLTKQEHQIIPVKQERQVPALIKAGPKDHVTSSEKPIPVPPTLLGKPRLKEKPKAHVQIQPPPELVMPQTKLRPPPLVKTKDSMKTAAQSSGSRPQVVVVPQHRTSSSVASGGKHTLSVSQQILRGDSSQAGSRIMESAVEMRHRQSPPASIGKSPLQLREMKAHYKPSKTAKAHTSSYSMKGMKMTQYEYPSIVPQTVSTQYQHAAVPVQNIPNLMTPMQFIQGVPGAPIQVPAYQNLAQMAPGGMLLNFVQSPQGVTVAQDVPATYITQGGQTYQLVSNTGEMIRGENSQKVSVIMNPPGSTYIRTSDMGGYYITQVDGPPPSSTKGKTKRKNVRKMRQKFEEMRRKEQAKISQKRQVSEDQEAAVRVPESSPIDVTPGNQQASAPPKASGSFQPPQSVSLPTNISKQLPKIRPRFDDNQHSDPAIDPTAQQSDLSATSSQEGERNSESSISGEDGGSVVDTHSLQKNRSAEDLMKERVKAYLEKGSMRKAKSTSSPLVEEPSPISSSMSTAAPAQEATPKGKGLKRRHSSSSLRSESSSPVRGRSSKSPRLVVSPSLFSCSGSEFSNPLTLPRTRKSLRAVETSQPESEPSKSHLSAFTPGSSSLADSSTGGVLSVHGSLQKPSAKESERSKGQSSKGKLKKRDQKKVTPPDLSILFQPDNAPVAESDRTSDPMKSPTEMQSPPSYTCKKVLQFSTTLSHSPSVKKPIPLKSGLRDRAEFGEGEEQSERTSTDVTTCPHAELNLDGTAVPRNKHVTGDSGTSIPPIERDLQNCRSENLTSLQLVVNLEGNVNMNNNNSNVGEEDNPGNEPLSNASPSHSLPSQSHSNPPQSGSGPPPQSEASKAKSSTSQSSHKQPAHTAPTKDANSGGHDPDDTDPSPPPPKKAKRGRPRKSEKSTSTAPATLVDREQARLAQASPLHPGSSPRTQAQQPREEGETSSMDQETPGAVVNDENVQRGLESCDLDLAPPPVKRKRGRPRKSETAKTTAGRSTREQDSTPLLAPPDLQNDSGTQRNDESSSLQQQDTIPAGLQEDEGTPLPRKRGRPRKNDITRKRGRPPKRRQANVSAVSGSSELNLPESHSHSLELESARRELEGETGHLPVPEEPILSVPTTDPELLTTPQGTKRLRAHKRKQVGEKASEHETPGQDDTSELVKTPSKAATPRSVAAETPGSSSTDTPQKKKRGRPRKNPESPATTFFQCPKCENVYTTQAGLNSHRDTVHGPDLSPDASVQDCLKVWRAMLKRVQFVMCHKCSAYRAKNITTIKYHYKRCGKSAEELTLDCPHCGKTYTTSQGLDYHVKTQHRTPSQPQDESEEPTPQSSDFFADPDINQPLPVREAAKRASSKLYLIAQELASTAKVSPMDKSKADGDDGDGGNGDGGGGGGGGGGDGGDGGEAGGSNAATLLAELAATNVDVGISLVDSAVQCLVSMETRKRSEDKEFEGKWGRESTVVPGFTNAQVSEFRKKILQEGSMECPVEGCSKQFKSLGGVAYHIQHHETQSYICPFCKKPLRSKKLFDNHLRIKHPDAGQNEDPTDTEYHPDSSDVAMSEDVEITEDWEELSKKTPGLKQVSSIALRKSLLPQTYREYKALVREITKSLWSQQLLFGEWQPRLDDWVPLEPGELSSYLPHSSSSLPFTFDPRMGGEEGTDQSLQLFASVETDHASVVFFTGGPVWALDWMPTPDSSADQYLALAAYRDLDEMFPLDAPISHRGVLQLWSVGQLSNTSDTLPLPWLVLGVAHEYGCLRALKWCPSGAWGREEGREVARLGLLGLACSDGCLRILSIPHPENLRSQLSSSSETEISQTSQTRQHGSTSTPDHPPPLFVRPQVAATLVPSSMGFSDWSVFGQCLCLDWLPSNGHRKIAAGFSSGVVCVWDLHSATLKGRSSSSELFIHPIVQLAAHSRPCRAVAWCPLEHNYLFTGGHDKMLNLWDIRQPHTPQEKMEKALVREVVWPLLWCGVYIAEDHAHSRLNGVQFLTYLHSTPGINARQTRLVTQSSAPVAGMSYCMWTDRVAAGSFGGELSITALPTNFHVTASPKTVLTKHQLLYRCKLEPLQDSHGAATNSATDSTRVREDDSAATQDSHDAEVESHPDSKTTVVPQSSHDVTMAETGIPQDSKATQGSHETVAEVGSLQDRVPRTMKEVASSHRVVFVKKPRQTQNSYSSDAVPINAVNKVCWNPNEHSCEWLLCAMNTGLVHLLRVLTPPEKPHLYKHR